MQVNTNQEAFLGCRRRRSVNGWVNVKATTLTHRLMGRAAPTMDDVLNTGEEEDVEKIKIPSA
jgi:hypothetical protein